MNLIYQFCRIWGEKRNNGKLDFEARIFVLLLFAQRNGKANERNSHRRVNLHGGIEMNSLGPITRDMRWISANQILTAQKEIYGAQFLETMAISFNFRQSMFQLRYLESKQLDINGHVMSTFLKKHIFLIFFMRLRYHDSDFP